MVVRTWSKHKTLGYIVGWCGDRRAVVYQHRDIWEGLYGPIPKGHHVHHIDGDKTHNCISNLELLSATEHQREHNVRSHCKKGHEFTPENTKAWNGKRKCRACTNERARRAYKEEGPHARS